MTSPSDPNLPKPADVLQGELVQMTYATIAEPEKFHELVDLWEECISASVLAEQDVASDSALSMHFNSALQIFDQIGRAKREMDRARTVLEFFTVPALICDSALNILHRNAKVGNWADDAAALRNLYDGELTRQITDWPEDQSVAFVPADRDIHGIGAAVITELPEAFQDNDPNGPPTGRHFFIVFNEISENNAAWTSIQDKYKLTAAEVSVLALLANGKRADEIAEEREVSINTVRAHIRALLEKTGSRNQNDLVRSSVFILSQFQSLQLVNQAFEPAGSKPEPLSSRVLLSSGRMLHFRQFGAPDGRPVLYLHGMMAGPDLPEHMKTAARQNNIRLICPSRPGFGKSDTIPATDMELVRQSCRDLFAFLDVLSIPRVYVIGHLSAAGIAVNFADRFPNRCVGVLNAGYSGLVDDAMIDQMGRMSRAFARTHQRSRTALRFLTRAAIAAVDFLGADRMVQRHMGVSPVDWDYCQDEGRFDMMSNGLTHALAQGGDAFIKDGYLALTNWGDVIARLSDRVPVACVLGKEDRISPNDRVLDLARDVPNFEVERFAGAGQLVLFQRWEEIMPRIHAAFDAKPLLA